MARDRPRARGSLRAGPRRRRARAAAPRAIGALGRRELLVPGFPGVPPALALGAVLLLKNRWREVRAEEGGLGPGGTGAVPAGGREADADHREEVGLQQALGRPRHRPAGRLRAVELRRRHLHRQLGSLGPLPVSRITTTAADAPAGPPTTRKRRSRPIRPSRASASSCGSSSAPTGASRGATLSARPRTQPPVAGPVPWAHEEAAPRAILDSLPYGR